MEMRSQLQKAKGHKEEEKIFQQGAKVEKSDEADNDDQTLSIKSQSIYSENQGKEMQKIQKNDNLDEVQKFEYINEKIQEWPSWVVEEKQTKELQKNEDISYQVISQKQYTKNKQQTQYQSIPIKQDKNKNQGEQKKSNQQNNKQIKRQPKARLGRSAIRFRRLQQERKMREILRAKAAQLGEFTETKANINQTINL